MRVFSRLAYLMISFQLRYFEISKMFHIGNVEYFN